MKNNEKNCGNCSSLDSGKMCNLCNVTDYSHWTPDESTKKRLVFQDRKYTDRPYKRENKFQEYRIKEGLSVRKMVKILGLSRNTIHRRIQGIPAVARTALLIYRKTGISPLDLVFPTKYLEEEELTREEIINGISTATNNKNESMPKL